MFDDNIIDVLKSIGNYETLLKYNKHSKNLQNKFLKMERMCN